MEEKYQNVNDKTNTEGKNNIETMSGSTLYKINQLDNNNENNDINNDNNTENKEKKNFTKNKYFLFKIWEKYN